MPRRAPHHLALVILNYRTPGLTLDCLDSLASQVEPDGALSGAEARVETIVVDNASGDGSAETIEEGIEARGLGGWARVLRSPVNGGFAAGNNLGIRAASDAADAFVLLNSDTLVRPGALAALLDAMERRPDAGLIGPRFVDGRGRPDVSAFRQLRPATELLRGAHTGVLTRLAPGLELPLPVADAPMEPDWLGFACVLVRREVVERVGLLDEGYFMYFEDVDYCNRVRDAGWRILYWPDAEVVHLLGGSSEHSAEENLHRRAPRYFYEARARYFAKFYGRRGLWLANTLWSAGHGLARLRELLAHRPPAHRAHEARDLWTNALSPLRPARTSPHGARA
ncbi:MAG TPA: glycosyltransferase family 2 protein [Sandaracinaceae bacterium LLY-WYZ-13_1]|nr:glycosyltransferase family 2 protein [Sandaracinaceae bacterium LLY-WYZ-13_1]